MTKRRARSSEEEREFRAWIERAKRVPIDQVLRKLGGTPKPDDRGGPCPRPGCYSALKPLSQSDRFSINRRKNVFFCRFEDAGGPPFALVQHVKDLPFMDAVEFVSGEKPPIVGRQESDEERRERERKLEAEERDAARRRADAEKAEQSFRDVEISRAFEDWNRGKPIAGTIVVDYFEKRGLEPPPGARLRFLADAPYWDAPPHQGGSIQFRGPCMAAAGTRINPDTGKDEFRFLHRTWIDLAEPKGKKKILDKRSGDLISAKKMRGSKKGASILLARQRNADGAIVRWFLSEGIENGSAVWRALRDHGSPLLDGAEFRAAGDLGNMSGKAAKNVPHPTLTKTDTKGRVRRLLVPGSDPIEPDPDPVIGIPDGVAELYLIEDGSSEPFFTQNAIARAAARFLAAYPNLTIYKISAAPGLDHNDMLLGLKPKDPPPAAVARDPRIFFEHNGATIYFVSKDRHWQEFWYAPVSGIRAEGRRNRYPQFDIRALPAEAYDAGAYEPIKHDLTDDAAFAETYEQEKAYHRSILQRLIDAGFDFEAECRRQWLILDPEFIKRRDQRAKRQAAETIEAVK
mgnify:CR=1 FL=1